MAAMTAEAAMTYLEAVLERSTPVFEELGLNLEQKVGVAKVVSTEIAMANQDLRRGLIAAGFIEEV